LFFDVIKPCTQKFEKFYLRAFHFPAQAGRQTNALFSFAYRLLAGFFSDFKLSSVAISHKKHIKKLSLSTLKKNQLLTE